MNKSIIKWTALGLAGAVVAVLLLPKLVPSASDDAGARPGGPGGGQRDLGVRGYVVLPAQLRNNIRTAGSVLAGDEVDITSEASGKVTSVHFREGSRVAKGQLLLKLNDAELQARLRQATYRRDLAQQKEQRQKELLAIEGISKQEYDIALNEVHTLEAEIDLLKAQIDKTEIRAPFAGTIGLTNISEGSYISPTTPIARLANTNNLRIEFSIPERYAAAVQPGYPVTFTIQGSPREYSARIYAIEPQIDPATRTLRMRALYNGGDGSVYPGAFVEVSFPLEHSEQALLVPTQSLVPDIAGPKVYVYRSGNAVPTLVQTGTRTEQFVEVTSGLEAGDTVLTTGLLQIRPGVGVTVTAIDEGGSSL